MTLIERLKKQIHAERHQRGYREKVFVQYSLLMEILDHAERDDTYFRSEHMVKERGMDIRQKLEIITEALFHEYGKDAGAVILSVLEPTLHRMREMKEKDDRMLAEKGRYES